MATGTNRTPDVTSEKPPRRRRWIPLSLKGFVAILLLVGVGGPLWIGLRGWRQQVAINEIERVGGEIETLPRGPEWLRAAVGESFLKWFDDAYMVHLGGSLVDDSTLAHLK